MIITICGSARFSGWLSAWHRALTLSGHLVWDRGVPATVRGRYNELGPEDDIIADRSMQNKVRQSGALLCLNPFAYMGEGTLALRAYAYECKVLVYTLESWGKGIGVGPSHTKALQYAKTAFFQVPEKYMSPVDTAGNWLCAYDLLASYSPLRQRLVKMVQEPKESALRSVALLQEQGVAPKERAGG